MDNLEPVLQCLNEFEKAKEKKIGPELEGLLTHIAKTGRTEFPWHLLKPLISYKLEKVLDDFFETNSSIHTCTSEPTSKSKDFCPNVDKLISNLNCFTGTPFTIQRLCELITEPKKYYKTTDKFLRGVEKNIMVVSTVQPDGVLITRSAPSVLTNGDLSPMKPSTASFSQNATLLNNSPLNTIAQEDTINPVISHTVTTKEHFESQTNKQGTVDSNIEQKAQESVHAKEQCASSEEINVPGNINCLETADSSEIGKTFSTTDRDSVPSSENIKHDLADGANDKTAKGMEKVEHGKTMAEEKVEAEEEKVENS